MQIETTKIAESCVVCLEAGTEHYSLEEATYTRLTEKPNLPSDSDQAARYGLSLIKMAP
jgi:hypothetical protein